MGFLLYKIYTRFFERNDSAPWERTFYYIGLNAVFLSFSLFIFFSGLLKRLNIRCDVFNAVHDWIKFPILLGAFPLLITYLIYFKNKNIDYYEKKYQNHWLNKIYFDAALLILPLILFLIGPILRIIFFGGYMLGKDYVGIW